MCTRIFIGPRPKTRHNFYTLRLDECGGDVATLAAKSAWRCPIRVTSTDQGQLNRYLEVLRETYYMDTTDPEQIRVLQ